MDYYGSYGCTSISDSYGWLMNVILWMWNYGFAHKLKVSSSMWYKENINRIFIGYGSVVRVLVLSSRGCGFKLQM